MIDIKYCARPFLTDQERQRAVTDARGKCRVSDDTVRRHDDGLLDAINSRVEQDDQLWILGDFCWGRFDEAAHYRERIVCRNAHLVWGNHDHRSIAGLFRSDREQGMIYLSRAGVTQGAAHEVSGLAKQDNEERPLTSCAAPWAFVSFLTARGITVEGQPIWLNHYPARSWDRRFHGSWHLYGQVHGRLTAQDEANPTMLTRDVATTSR